MEKKEYNELGGNVGKFKVIEFKLGQGFIQGRGSIVLNVVFFIEGEDEKECVVEYILSGYWVC